MFSCRSFQKGDEGLVYAITEATMRRYVEETFGSWMEERLRESIAALNPTHCKIIQIENRDVGLIVVERNEQDIQLDSLYLLPAAQNRGIGTTLLRELKAEARNKKLPLRLRVLQSNPARLWYQREGFVTTRITPERWFMEFNP
jgi:ribosomal protein S18 acetylase RimI-like enzyme